MNFEEELREKLNKRSIEPSPDAWKRVAAGLQKEDRNKKRFFWPKLAIAAGFAGIIILSTTFFLDKGETRSIPVVEIPQPVKKNQEQYTTTKKKREKTDEFMVSSGQKSTKNGNLLPENPESRITEQAPEIQQLPLNTEEKTNQHPENLVQEVRESVAVEVSRLLAEVSTAEQQGEQVSDATIDSLLARAREKILNDRFYEEQTESLSATALLQSVESELDQSFRDRVFDALKDGFIKAREAVASRND